MNMAVIKVSVRISAYNHGKFISQAIESALMQKTDFAYEIIIGEDCSTDNTRQIVTQYQRRYPDRIRLLLHEKNIGRLNNFKQTYLSCRGHYIASLDGDDYWTTPNKLQKQADFLDSHPECAMCFHNVNLIYEDGRPSHPDITKSKPFATIEDLLHHCFISSCSAMSRKRFFTSFPVFFDEMPVYDWSLYLVNAEYGLIGYIDEIMGAWRQHSGGIWTAGGTPSAEKLIMRNQWSLKFYEVINRYLGFRYNSLIQERIKVHEDNLRQLGHTKPSSKAQNNISG